MNDDFLMKLTEEQKWNVRTDLAYDDALKFQNNGVADFIQTEEEINNIPSLPLVF